MRLFRALFCVFLLTFPLLLSAQVIEVSERWHDFGDIQQGDVVEHRFELKNVGKAPLVLQDVRLTCGCTATDWSREPVLPGQSMTLTLRFDSKNKVGIQNKTAMLISNAQNGPLPLTLRTNVLPPPKTGN